MHLVADQCIIVWRAKIACSTDIANRPRSISCSLSVVLNRELRPCVLSAARGGQDSGAEELMVLKYIGLIEIRNKWRNPRTLSLRCDKFQRDVWTCYLVRKAK
jgi:hypothetical protein